MYRPPLVASKEVVVDVGTDHANERNSLVLAVPPVKPPEQRTRRQGALSSSIFQHAIGVTTAPEVRRVVDAVDALESLEVGAAWHCLHDARDGRQAFTWSLQDELTIEPQAVEEGGLHVALLDDPAHRDGDGEEHVRRLLGQRR